MSQFLKIENPSHRAVAPPPRFALWQLGFRPFYLLGAAFAALAVPLWILQYAGGAALPLAWTPQTWHAHEMVFGFALAVVTGFLFTAVRNWTGLPTPTGWRLAGLCALWLAARLAYLFGATTSALAVELAFLGMVAASLLPALVRTRNRRNYFVGILFLVMAVVDLVFHAVAAGAGHWLSPTAAGRLGLYLIVTLTIVIAGRVVPTFTLNAVRGLKQFRNARLDRAALGAAVLAFALDLAGVGGGLLGAAAALAAILLAVRLAGWGPWATLRNPLLWVLHLSCAWLAVGFALMAASALGWTAPSLSSHAFGLGGIGGLVIGMITRTALGHTGRMLVARRPETAMYLMVHAAVLLRVVGPLVAPQHYFVLLIAATAFWSGGFLLYVLVYAPRLVRARVDGREG